MLILIWRIIFIQAAVETFNTSKEEFFLLKRFKVKFENNSNIKNWRKIRNIKSIPAFKLLKEIISKVAEIILEIDTDKYSVGKSLIMETEMNVFQLGSLF